MALPRQCLGEGAQPYGTDMAQTWRAVIDQNQTHPRYPLSPRFAFAPSFLGCNLRLMLAQGKALPTGARLLRLLGRQTRIPFGLRHRLARRFADPDSMPPTPFACDFFGLAYEGDLASYIDWNVYFHGAYERGLLSFLKNAAIAAGPGTVFLDIGANVGQHSLFMSAHATQVHAFEPWAVARRAITRKIALNRIGNVTVHSIGLSDHDHEEIYYAPTLSNRGTGSFVASHNLSNRNAGRLPLVAGDTYLAAHGIDRVDVIKVDVEGFEPQALAGLAATIARCRPVVALECNPASARDDPCRIFGPDWLAYVLGGGPDRYRLEPPTARLDGATIVMVPREKRAYLAASG